MVLIIKKVRPLVSRRGHWYFWLYSCPSVGVRCFPDSTKSSGSLQPQSLLPYW